MKQCVFDIFLFFFCLKLLLKFFFNVYLNKFNLPLFNNMILESSVYFFSAFSCLEIVSVFLHLNIAIIFLLTSINIHSRTCNFWVLLIEFLMNIWIYWLFCIHRSYWFITFIYWKCFLHICYCFLKYATFVTFIRPRDFSHFCILYNFTLHFIILSVIFQILTNFFLLI